jgi:multicomponent Na+:H+ antiporter subunit D
VQERAGREPVDELRTERDRTPLPMVIAPGVLLAGACAVGLIPGAVPAIEQAAVRFADHGAYAAWVLRGEHVRWPVAAPSHVSADDVVYGLLATAGAFAAAAVGLFGRPLRQVVPRVVGAPAFRAVRFLRELHSGHIGDYIAWWTAGASLLGATCLLTLG